MSTRLFPIVALAIGLSACGATHNETAFRASQLTYAEMETPYGVVPCVLFSPGSYEGGGISCSWDHIPAP